MRRAEALLNLAGATGAEVDLEALSKTAEPIYRAYAFVFEPASLPAQTFRSPKAGAEGAILPDIDFLQADYLNIAGIEIAYAVIITMRAEPSGDGLLWRQVDIKPVRLATVWKGVDAFKDFVAAGCRQTGVNNTIIRSVDTGK